MPTSFVRLRQNALPMNLLTSMPVSCEDRVPSDIEPLLSGVSGLAGPNEPILFPSMSFPSVFIFSMSSSILASRRRSSSLFAFELSLLFLGCLTRSGKTQSSPERLQLAHGCVLSHLIFLCLQCAQLRGCCIVRLGRVEAAGSNPPLLVRWICPSMTRECSWSRKTRPVVPYYGCAESVSSKAVKLQHRIRRFRTAF